MTTTADTTTTVWTGDPMKRLFDDIRHFAGHIGDEHRAEFTRITGLVLPAPGDRVSWTSRFGGRHTGTVDDVFATRQGVKARVEEDRTEGRPTKTMHTLDVDDLTYHTGCATVGRVVDEHGRLISTGGVR